MLTRIDVRGQSGAALAGALPRPEEPGRAEREAVAAIVERVRREGDGALLALTREFDGVTLEHLAVPDSELHDALARISEELRQALLVAHRNIAAYHAHEMAVVPDFVAHGVRVRHLIRPVERVGCYAPGGRARYPSTVLMCAVPARVAGVEQVVLCVPPGRDGRVNDATLAAAALAGVDEVYALGGAQAIAAMAYGTESVRRVDVVVGPGNRYVAEAKRQVSGLVGVASAFAGPSEVVVVAAPDTPAEFAAIDLAVQAEHGPDGLAWLVTWSEQKADEVEEALERVVASSPRREDLAATLRSGGYTCIVDGPRHAIDVANVVAPEHLELLFEQAEELLGSVRAAGAVFCGPWSPASLGDYVAGPNHVLPTNRTARFASALRADDFCRHFHAVSAQPAAMEMLGPAVEALAETEGLPAHATSVALRRAALEAGRS
ncbi:MAG: histidinol dehydrogenase [Acidimicrobiales bacterium]